MNNLPILSKDINMSDPEQFRQIVQQAKDLQNQLDDFWKQVAEEMQTRGMKSIKGDFGSLSFAERMNWKINANVDDYYLKPVADTKKLRAAWDAGELPQGADFTTTTYLVKKIK